MKNISGDQLFQKKYTTDTLPVRQMLNKGEREQYYYSQRHEPIISREDFDKVQKILNEHKKSFKEKKTAGYLQKSFTAENAVQRLSLNAI